MEEGDGSGPVDVERDVEYGKVTRDVTVRKTQKRDLKMEGVTLVKEWVKGLQLSTPPGWSYHLLAPMTVSSMPREEKARILGGALSPLEPVPNREGEKDRTHVRAIPGSQDKEVHHADSVARPTSSSSSPRYPDSDEACFVTPSREPSAVAFVHSRFDVDRWTLSWDRILIIRPAEAEKTG